MILAGNATYQKMLLTGGAGFVGARLAPRLSAAFPLAERVLLCRPGSVPTLAPAGWRLEIGDVVDQDAMAALIGRLRPDLVIHLAAQSSVGSSATDALETWDVNFGGTRALVRACACLDVATTFLFASSAEVYGRGFRDGPVREDTPLQPGNAYARSKAAAEGILLDIASKDTRVVVARAFNHTGAGQDARFVLPSFAAQIAAIESGRQRPVVKVGNLDAERDFLDVADVCDAYMRLIGKAGDLPPYSIFNISSGSAQRIGALLGLMKERAHRDFSIEVDPARLRRADIPRAVGANDRLREAVQWEPVTPIEETLSAVLHAARETERQQSAR